MSTHCRILLKYSHSERTFQNPKYQITINVDLFEYKLEEKKAI